MKRITLIILAVAAIIIAGSVSCQKINDINEEPETPENSTIPEGALPGIFSVSETRKVYFSKGNLFYDGSRFKFEDNQYSYHGYDSPYNTWGLFGWEGASGLLDGDLSLFGASTSVSHADYGSTKDEVLKRDWGYAINKEIWRTLTANEWEFLFKGRTNKYGYATINNVPGIIILPDSFIDPKTNHDGEPFVPNHPTIGWDANIYNGENWEEMEKTGAIFLPAAGFRYGSDVIYVGEFCKYWSCSSCGDKYAYNFCSYDDVIPVNMDMRYTGCSIRLVTDAK